MRALAADTLTRDGLPINDDGRLYAKTAYGTPPDNCMYYLNNTFNRGAFVNGVDFYQKIDTHWQCFPIGATMEWSWPVAASSTPSFAYSWSNAYFGDSYGQNPYNVVGPWSGAGVQVKNLGTLQVTYDLSVGGNLNSYDVLLDSFVTATATSHDNSYVAEISFYPYNVPNITQYGTAHTFTGGAGLCLVGKNGTEILIQPVSGSGPYTIRPLLAATIDLKEIYQYCVTQGFLTGNEYVRGFGLGPEVQMPAAYNSAPHQGSLRINQLSYNWSL